jgi:tol-pal system protein YbgF
MSRNISVLLVVSLVTLGCASSRKLDQISLQTSVLEKQNQAIENKLIELDSVSKSLLEALTIFKARTEFSDKSGDARLEEISSKLNDVIDRMERLEQSFAALQSGILKTPITPASDTTADSTGGISYVDAKKLYDTAFKDMASGNYALAILGFREYVKAFPKTDLSDDAQFWVGECHYRQTDYAMAKEEYLKAEKDYPGSDKMPSVLYKLGRCFQETGDNKSAKKYYESVVAKFEGSAEAELAKEKLASSTR